VRGKLRIVTLIVALSLSAIGFKLFNLFVDSVLSTYNVNWKIDITRGIQIDLYGGVMPTAISILLVLCLIFLTEFSLKQYLHYFLISFALAFVFFRISDTAIVGFYFIFTLSISFLAVFISFSKGALSEFLKSRDLHKLEFTKRNYVAALLIATSYASLSVLIVDLAYAPFAISMYIGAMGLIDGILLSGLLAPLGVTFVTLFTWFVYEMKCGE
jgi:hypothetical protein